MDEIDWTPERLTRLEEALKLLMENSHRQLVLNRLMERGVKVLMQVHDSATITWPPGMTTEQFDTLMAELLMTQPKK